MSQAHVILFGGQGLAGLDCSNEGLKEYVLKSDKEREASFPGHERDYQLHQERERPINRTFSRLERVCERCL